MAQRCHRTLYFSAAAGSTAIGFTSSSIKNGQELRLFCKSVPNAAPDCQIRRWFHIIAIAQQYVGNGRSCPATEQLSGTSMPQCDARDAHRLHIKRQLPGVAGLASTAQLPIMHPCLLCAADSSVGASVGLRALHEQSNREAFVRHTPLQLFLLYLGPNPNRARSHRASSP